MVGRSPSRSASDSRSASIVPSRQGSVDPAQLPLWQMTSVSGTAGRQPAVDRRIRMDSFMALSLAARGNGGGGLENRRVLEADEQAGVDQVAEVARAAEADHLRGQIVAVADQHGGEL